MNITENQDRRITQPQASDGTLLSHPVVEPFQPHTAITNPSLLRETFQANFGELPPGETLKRPEDEARQALFAALPQILHASLGSIDPNEDGYNYSHEQYILGTVIGPVWPMRLRRLYDRIFFPADESDRFANYDRKEGTLAEGLKHVITYDPEIYEKIFDKAMAAKDYRDEFRHFDEVASALRFLAPHNKELFLQLYQRGLEEARSFDLQLYAYSISGLAGSDPDKFIELYQKQLDMIQSGDLRFPKDSMIEGGTYACIIEAAKIPDIDEDIFSRLFFAGAHTSSSGQLDTSFRSLKYLAEHNLPLAKKLYKAALDDTISEYTPFHAIKSLHNLALQDKEEFLTLFTYALDREREKGNGKITIEFTSALPALAFVDPDLYVTLYQEWMRQGDDIINPNHRANRDDLRKQLVRSLPAFFAVDPQKAEELLANSSQYWELDREITQVQTKIDPHKPISFTEAVSLLDAYESGDYKQREKKAIKEDFKENPTAYLQKIFAELNNPGKKEKSKSIFARKRSSYEALTTILENNDIAWLPKLFNQAGLNNTEYVFATTSLVSYISENKDAVTLLNDDISFLRSLKDIVTVGNNSLPLDKQIPDVEILFDDNQIGLAQLTDISKPLLTSLIQECINTGNTERMTNILEMANKIDIPTAQALSEIIAKTENPDPALMEDILSILNVANNTLQPKIKDLLKRPHLERDGIVKDLLSELTRKNPRAFVSLAQRKQWELVFGQEVLGEFLNALPTRTDEKRNAFTHNPYDRTTAFMEHMLTHFNQSGLRLTSEEFPILTTYVRKFGLSTTPKLYNVFKHLQRLEWNPNYKLPKSLEALGMHSLEDLDSHIRDIQKLVFGEGPIEIADLKSLSPVALDILESVTGVSTHSFGKKSIKEIIKEYKESRAAGEIAQLPEGYKTEVMNVKNTHLEIANENAKDDYEILRSEMLDSIQSAGSFEDLSQRLQEALANKYYELQAAIQMASSDDRRQSFLQQDLSRFEEYQKTLSQVDNLDSLTLAVVGMKFDKKQQGVADAIIRNIAMRKYFFVHHSPAYIQNLSMILQNEQLTPQTLLTTLTVIDNNIKDHVLNMDANDHDKYWSKEAFRKLSQDRRGRRLFDSFYPYIGNIAEAVKELKTIETDTTTQVFAIPDRGLIGEMAGYLANACYTGVESLLSEYPNVVPYKMVTRDPATDVPSFIGSVLVFELKGADGKPILLVRAFDVPDEENISIPEIIEQFMDIMTEVAKKRQATQIRVPGNHGAISNYPLTINHMEQNYIKGKTPESLSERFAFNYYDLTNDTYVTRTIGGQ